MLRFLGLYVLSWYDVAVDNVMLDSNIAVLLAAYQTYTTPASWIVARALFGWGRVCFLCWRGWGLGRGGAWELWFGFVPRVEKYLYASQKSTSPVKSGRWWGSCVAAISKTFTEDTKLVPKPSNIEPK